MIAICTPTRDTVNAGFAFDLVRLVQRYSDSLFIISQGTLLPNQRTQLTKKVLESLFSHILFIDSDMRFPEDTVMRLLAHGKEIVGANCKQRQADLTTTGIDSEGKTGLEEVEKIGFGVTLIDTRVFTKIAEPWFATPFDGEQFVGEDIFFCHKAKEAGLQIFVDHDLSKEVGHVGSYEFKF